MIYTVEVTQRIDYRQSIIAHFEESEEGTKELRKFEELVFKHCDNTEITIRREKESANNDDV